MGEIFSQGEQSELELFLVFFVHKTLLLEREYSCSIRTMFMMLASRNQLIVTKGMGRFDACDALMSMMHCAVDKSALCCDNKSGSVAMSSRRLSGQIRSVYLQSVFGSGD